MQDSVRDRAIHDRIRNRQRLGIRQQEINPLGDAGRGRLLPRALQQCGRQVDRDDTMTVRRERDGDAAGARSDIDDARSVRKSPGPAANRLRIQRLIETRVDDIAFVSFGFSREELFLPLFVSIGSADSKVEDSLNGRIHPAARRACRTRVVRRQCSAAGRTPQYRKRRRMNCAG